MGQATCKLLRHAGEQADLEELVYELFTTFDGDSPGQLDAAEFSELMDQLVTPQSPYGTHRPQLAALKDAVPRNLV